MSWSDFLRIEMLQTYDNLNNKVESCRQNRKLVNKQDITSKWFNELSHKQRVAALLLLSHIKTSKCTEEEESNYTRALLNYVAETGDSQRLDDWLSLKKVFIHRDLQLDFDSIDLRKIQLLSEVAPFNTPFDPLQISELYRQ